MDGIVHASFVQTLPIHFTLELPRQTVYSSEEGTWMSIVDKLQVENKSLSQRSAIKFPVDVVLEQRAEASTKFHSNSFQKRIIHINQTYLQTG